MHLTVAWLSACRSLADLLSSHKLVKAQLNGSSSSQVVEQMAQQLADAVPSGRLLLIKGNTMLFAAADTNKQTLMQV